MDAGGPGSRRRGDRAARNGKHFSAGHDLRGGGPVPDKITLEFIIEHEARRYLEYTLRWRNVPKPSIAAVQGRCISGGLLLCWPCDLIVAADDAQFSDPVVLMGIGGVEYHGHTWELGPRKAKEILFTGRAMTAEEVLATGMVNKVVPRAELDSQTRALAEQIAKMPPFALRQAKRAVNQTLDVQASTPRSSRCSTSTRPGTATRSVSGDGRCWWISST